MPDPDPRSRQIFFEIYEGLPRQGPGNRASLARALALCVGLPPAPAILDLGCGVGAQTLHLAELSAGRITALDRHAPLITRLTATVAARGLAGRIRPRVGDMAVPGEPPASFDLIWSEGALYNIGIPAALRVCHGLLRPGGYLVFTDAVWRKENPPSAIKAGFDADYPTMGRVETVIAAISAGGFAYRGGFTLPDEAWWDDFYTPMEQRIADLRRRYAGDDAALAVLDEVAREPALHRQYGDYYAYQYFVARRV